MLIAIAPLLIPNHAPPFQLPDLSETVRVDVELNVLRFTDISAFRNAMLEFQSAVENHRLPNYDGVLQQFEDSLGFYSLRRAIEDTENSEYQPNIHPKPKDDLEWKAALVPDSSMQAVLNPNLELMIGASFVKLDHNQMIEIVDGDPNDIEMLRDGGTLTGPNIRTHAVRVEVSEDTRHLSGTSHPQGCPSAGSTFSEALYAEGQRRISGKGYYVNYGPFYAAIGAWTKHYRKEGTKWKKESADWLGVQGSYTWFKMCHNSQGPGRFGKTERSVWKIEYKNACSGLCQARTIDDCLSVQHLAYDNASAGYSYTDHLGNAAIPRFNLPDRVPFAAPLPFDASPTLNADGWWLEIYRTTEVGDHDVAGPYWSAWQPIGTLNDLHNLRNVWNGGAFWPGVYRVKLAVFNGCTWWNEVVDWIEVESPRPFGEVHR